MSEVRTAITTGTTPASNTRESKKGQTKAFWERRDKKHRRLWADYYTPSSDHQAAHERMAGALFDEISKCSHSPATRPDAQDFAQENILKIIEKLDNGCFKGPSPYDSFRAYVEKVKRECKREIDKKANKDAKTYSPVLEEKEDEDGEIYLEDATVTFDDDGKRKGNRISSDAPDFTRLSVVSRQDRSSSALITAFETSEFDIAKTAVSLGINTVAASKRLSRLRNSLKLSELEATLKEVFGVQNYSRTAREILPLIPILTQRAVTDYPTLWAEALTLQPRKKVRRVQEDRAKSTWIQAVRWLYRLWVRNQSGDSFQPVPTQIVQTDNPSPDACLKAFDDIVSVFQEWVVSPCDVQAIKYGRGAEVGKATHVGNSKQIRPSASDFVCDVSLAARRCLTRDQYAYFRKYYESAYVVVVPEDVSSLQGHVDSFPESQRAAVASLDGKIRRTLGAELIRVGIYPFSEYVRPVDCRTVAPVTIQANAEPEPKGKLLAWPSAAMLDIQASADCTFEPLLGVEEAAKLLCVHPKTVQALARAGTIPCARMGKYWRFRASVLDAWVTDQLISDQQSRRVG